MTAIFPPVPPNLYQRHVNVLRHFLHRGLDFIGHSAELPVRFCQVIAATLLGDDLFVNAAGSPVVVAQQVAWVKRSVIGLGRGQSRRHRRSQEKPRHVERRHGAGIEAVRSRVKLHQVDLKPTTSRQPMEAAAVPCPVEDTTPPVTKIYFAAMNSSHEWIDYGLVTSSRWIAPSSKMAYANGRLPIGAKTGREMGSAWNQIWGARSIIQELACGKDGFYRRARGKSVPPWLRVADDLLHKYFGCSPLLQGS